MGHDETPRASAVIQLLDYGIMGIIGMPRERGYTTMLDVRSTDL